MHRRCSPCLVGSRLATPGFEMWIFVAWAIFFTKKIRWHSPRRKKAKSPGCRTADALDPLSTSMVDCCCAHLLRICCDGFHFVPRISLIRRRFSTVMWCVGCRKHQESRHHSHTQPSAHIDNNWWHCGWQKMGGRHCGDGGPKMGSITWCVFFSSSKCVAFFLWDSGANLVNYVKENALSRCSLCFY